MEAAVAWPVLDVKYELGTAQGCRLNFRMHKLYTELPLLYVYTTV